MVSDEILEENDVDISNDDEILNEKDVNISNEEDVEVSKEENLKILNKEDDKNLYKNRIILGYLLLILGGIFGFIVGVSLLLKDNKRGRKHGLIIVIIFVVMLLGSMFVIYNNAYTTGYDDARSYIYTEKNYAYNIGYDAGFIDGWNFDVYRGTGQVNGTTIYSRPYLYNPYKNI